MTEQENNISRRNIFTKREAQLLQSLVDGTSRKQRSDSLGISNEDFRIYSRLIAEKLGSQTRQDGIRDAIVRGVKFDFLDTSNLPLEPLEPLSPRESQVLIAMVRGYGTSQTLKELGISRLSLRSYRSKAYEKLGRCSQYQAIAWAARDMKERGQL